jgi:hypothetical protein
MGVRKAHEKVKSWQASAVCQNGEGPFNSCDLLGDWRRRRKQ